MKKSFKRIISSILALMIAFGSVFSVMAMAKSDATPLYDVTDKAVQYDGTPVILVRGMLFDGLKYKLGTEEEQNCFKGIDAGVLIKTALKAIGAGIIHFSYESAVDVINEYLEDIMGLMACNADGTSKYDVSVKQYPLSLKNYPELWDSGDRDEPGILKGMVERYGAENVYYYNYDWRLDPFMHADKINELVNQAVKDTGKEKVNIMCCSMGGILTDSYIYKYGTSKLGRVEFLSSTITGTHVTTDLLRGYVIIDAENLYTFMNQKLAGDNAALGFLFKVLYKTKLISAVCKLANDLVPHLKEPVYKGFLRDTFGTMPTIWALVLPEGYEEALKFMFEGEEEKYAGIIELSKEYQEMAKVRDDMLRKAYADGVDICLVAGYNSACIPVYPGGGCNGDSILESDRMLGEAKVAPLGKTLENAPDTKYVSPDKVVDLTDALFPDKTWAISGSRHVCGDYGTDYAELIFEINEYQGFCTPENLGSFSRFMIGDQNGNLQINK